MKELYEQERDEIIPEMSPETGESDLDVEVEGELIADKLKSLRSKLGVCESEKMKSLEELQRARADFLNSKRRLDEQHTRDKEKIIEIVVANFLPLLDSFETALASKEADTETNNSWKSGILAMHNQFLSILKSYDIDEIETHNMKFNPYEHDAIQNVPSDDEFPPDTIVTVAQKGFKRKGVIIRAAKVIVAT